MIEPSRIHFTDVEITPTGEPTKQERVVALDGGPLEALSSCRWCGGMHPTACPFIKIAEWHPNGQLSRVVLKERSELEKAIVYPFEDDEVEAEKFLRGLSAIAEASTLKAAREIASSLLALIDEEKPQ
jgi:hypothetical protein